MAIGTAGWAAIVIALTGYSLSPSEKPDAGQRVETDSFTAPAAIARCITANINRKKPELMVRTRGGDSTDGRLYIILNNLANSDTTFGVIRVDPTATGSHLTTWLPTRSLYAAPDEIAQKLIAGC